MSCFERQPRWHDGPGPMPFQPPPPPSKLFGFRYSTPVATGPREMFWFINILKYRYLAISRTSWYYLWRL
jgi:hypothetical protein